jgi:nucleolin
MKQAKAALQTAQVGAVAAVAPVNGTPVSQKENGKAPKTDDLSSLAKLKGNKKADAEEKSTPSSGGAPPSDSAPPSAKVFVRNLNFQIDDDGIKAFFKDCGSITDIVWIEDKVTKRFKGCGILTFESVEVATKAVAKTGEQCMGREIACAFANASEKKGGGDKGDKVVDVPLSERPEGCTTCFVGNLSYDIEDKDMEDFAKECGEVKQIRWLYHKDTNDFKGCGFVEFYDSESVDKFVVKNGTSLKGRRIRIDYSGSKSR